MSLILKIRELIYEGMFAAMPNVILGLGLLALLLFVLLYFIIGFKCLFSKIWIGRILGIVLLLPPVLLFSKCAIIYYKHNGQARQMLEKVRKTPLPPGSRVVCENTDVYSRPIAGFRFAAGYEIFITDIPKIKVYEFYSHYKVETKNYDLDVYNLDMPNLNLDLDMNEIRSHVPKEDWPRAYLLVAMDSCEMDGIWDFRLW